MKFGIFYNEKSGQGAAKKIAILGQEKIKETQNEALLISGAQLAEAVAALEKVLFDLDVLIVIGGDGTLSCVLSVMLALDHPLPTGLIPAGTINNFARYYQLPTQPEAAFDLILHQAQVKKVGIAKCGPKQVVVSSLTFGNLADIGNEVRQKDKRRFGWLVYLAQAVKQIGKNKSYEIVYTIDHKTYTFKTWFALITIKAAVGGIVYDKKSPGLMHLSLLNNIGFKQVFDYIYFAMTGRLRESKQITTFQAHEITIRGLEDQKITTRIDGDKGPKLPLTITYLPEYLPLLVKR